jgi:(2Fe-2S) ferredoxin
MTIYKHHLFVCTNQRPANHPKGCCGGRKSKELRNYMKARIKELGLEGARVNTSGCLGRCEEGPVVVIYPEGVWYKISTKQNIEMIIESHIINGSLVEELLLTH